MAEQVQSGPQQSRARRFLGAGKRTLDGEDRSERIKTGRKGTPFRAFSPTIKPEFPLNKGKFPDDERTMLVVAFVDQGIEHHAAILFLMRSGFDGSAFALTRSVTEILVRGVWMLGCATDEQVKKFVKHDKIEQTFGELSEAVDKTAGLEYFSEFKKHSWDTLNSYAH